MEKIAGSARRRWSPGRYSWIFMTGTSTTRNSVWRRMLLMQEQCSYSADTISLGSLDRTVSSRSARSRRSASAGTESCWKQYAEARRWMRAGIRGLVSGTRERGEEVKRLAPLRQMLDYIASEAEAGKVSLMPLRGITGTRTRLPDSPRAEIIGWWARGKYERQDTKTRRIMHLNESTTFSWYHREMRRQGREVTFSWSAVLQEAKNGYGAYEHRLRVGRHKRQIRLVSMPLKLLNISEVH